MPPWYIVLLAADRLHCSAVDLYREPSEWRDRALIALQAEGKAGVLIKDRMEKMRAAGFGG